MTFTPPQAVGIFVDVLGYEFSEIHTYKRGKQASRTRYYYLAPFSFNSKKMKTGTKSVLFGVHAFWWHPITVLLAWIDLYGEWPTWRELVAIFCHDLGYIGKEDMDGEDGKTHPELGAKITEWLAGKEAGELSLFHSRSYAKKADALPSKLAWADKWSPMFDPLYFYWIRASLSGEIYQYKRTFPRGGGQSNLMWTVAFKEFIRLSATDIWAGSQGDHTQYTNDSMLSITSSKILAKRRA